MFYRKRRQNQIPSRGEPSILILPWCIVLAGFTTASHETRTSLQAEVKDACDSRLLRWPWLEKGSSNIRKCSFSPLNSPLVLLLPQRLRLSWRTWQLPQGRNGTVANTLSPTASEVASSVCAVTKPWAGSERRTDVFFTVSSFHSCTHFVINLSADEMKHRSDYKCIFKTSLLSIISQWLDKENFWFTICFLIPFWVKIMSK